MINTIGYIVGIISEFLLFLYFSNTTFYPRKNYPTSVLVSLGGYALLCVIGFWSNATLSIISFFVVNVVLLMYGYGIKIKNAVFFSLMLDVLSCIGEYVFLYIMGFRFFTDIMGFEHLNNNVDIMQYKMILAPIGSKILYLIGIQILKKFIGKKLTYEGDSQTILITIPMLTIICLSALMVIEMDNLVFCCFVWYFC